MGCFWLCDRQRRGWWESITTDDGLPPPEVLTYDEYTFDFLGLENEEERNGSVESGKSATTNLKSPGILGSVFKSSGGRTGYMSVRWWSWIFGYILEEFRSLLYSCFIASTSGGEIGAGTNESDYTSFTLAFPTIKFPGSYAFTVVMWNGISE